MEQITELDLVVTFQKAELRKDAAEAELKTATMEYDMAESKLIELLEAKNATKTAEYSGIGHVTMLKPRLFARVDVGNNEILFSYLRNIGRAELIKEVVYPPTLSSFTTELISKGEKPPEFISYYIKSKARFYPQNK
jgi:hypothetical protein